MGGWSELPLEMPASRWSHMLGGVEPGCQSHDGEPQAEGGTVFVGSAVEPQTVSGARKVGMLEDRA